MCYTKIGPQVTIVGEGMLCVGDQKSDMYPKIKFHQNIEIIYRWRFKKLS